LNIPLLNIKDENFTLPIQLKYYYYGLVVVQIPSQLRLGWNLDAGGKNHKTIQV